MLREFCGRFLALKKRQRGQALVEYLLVLLLAIAFSRFIFFHDTYGIKPNLDKMVLRLGSYLEGNLKSGTKTGPYGRKSGEPYAGTDTWKN